jgi:amino acid permease
MTKRTRLFIRSTQALIGAVIGVGIFGIPYVFAQAGVGIGLVHLVVLGTVNLLMLLAYVDIVLNTNGHHRLVGNVKEYLGDHWGWLMTIALFFSSWGAMVAYVILGGGFLHALISPLTGGTVFIFQMLFAIVFGLLMIGGLSMISRLEVVFVFVLIVLLVLIMIGALPHADASNLLEWNAEHTMLPFGVVLFAFGGLAVLPEMRDILGKHKRLLRRSVLWGFGIIAVVYALFATIVVSVTGRATTQEAILGLGEVMGDWAVTLGSLIGFVAVGTSFLILGVQIMNSMVYDYKRRYLSSWALAAGVPVAVFLLGARDFIDVIGFTGGVLASLVGLIMIYMYLKAKRHACTPKRCLAIPNWTMYLSALILFAGMIATIFGLEFFSC